MHHEMNWYEILLLGINKIHKVIFHYSLCLLMMNNIDLVTSDTECGAIAFNDDPANHVFCPKYCYSPTYIRPVL